MYERFDIIVASSMVFGIPILCEKVQVPCVIQTSALIFNLFDFNLPNTFSLLKPRQLTQFTYRLYNAVFNIRVVTKLIPKIVPALYTVFRYLPQIPGPFQYSYSVKNIVSSKIKCLNLISMASAFYPPSYPDPYTKYLGAFLDNTSLEDDDSALTAWTRSKPISSILYGAFGSSSIIPYTRMYNLVDGLAKFLLHIENSFLVLALRSVNYDTYLSVSQNLLQDESRKILENKERVWVEKGFVKQKWILQQKSITVFISHCGMGSVMEALYFSKPILGMPFSREQFANAMAIANLNVGQPIFATPYDLVNYTFTAESVTTKTLDLWMNVAYEKAAREMSLEMKHTGGLQRAVEEIEFFAQLNGNLDRFTPFQNTLSFYQRHMLDLMVIFIILPGLIIIKVVFKCSKRRNKTKTD